MSTLKTRVSDPSPAVLAGLLSGVLLCSTSMAQQSSAPKPAVDSAGLEEVVVTANKRSENVQVVPASISVQAGDLLLDRHQEQLSDYANNVPGLNVGNLGKAGLASVNLRGIASVSNSASVGTYVDEVPLGSSSRFGNPANQIADVLPYDMDRLEILRGPQGTLYGAGSMGGLIKYVLKSADTKEFSARLGGDFGSVDGAGQSYYSLRGAVNVPIVTDKLGLRVSAYDKHTPGYIDNIRPGAPNAKDSNRQTQRGGRAALLWQPTDSVSVKLAALISFNEALDGGTVSYQGFTPVVTTDGSAIGTVSAPYGDLVQRHAFPQQFRANVGVYTATINWDTGPFEIVSASGWSNQRTYTTVDQTTAIAGIPILPPGTLLGGYTNTKIEKFTQELRLVSPQDQTFEWMIGGFYTDEDVSLAGPLTAYTPTYQPFIDPLLANNDKSTYEETAFFVNGTWNLSDKFDISAGARHANNKQFFQSNPSGPLGGPPQLAPNSSDSVNTWSLAARYQFSTDAMLYGRIATGYRAGGRNNAGISTTGVIPPAVDSDTLTSYEIGLKSEYPEHRALLNVTAFFINWEDIQLNSTQGGTTLLTNGGKAESKGLELTGSISPVDGLSLGINAAYTDSKLKTTSAGAFFLTGYQLPGVPKTSFSLTADYDWAVMGDWQAHVGGALRQVDKVWLTGVQLAGRAAPAIEAPSYTLVNLNASLAHGRVTYKAYANNVGNKRAIQGGLQLINLANQPQQGDFWIVQPRTIGVGVDVKF